MIGGFVGFVGIAVGLVLLILIWPKMNKEMRLARGVTLTFSLLLIANFLLAIYFLKYPTRSMIDSRNEASLSERSARRSAECENRGAALAAATIAVKGRLRDPSSAEFPSINDSNTSISYVGKCMFSVISYVRSRNGFGGMNTVAYAARVRFNKDSERWNAESIDMKE